MTKIEVSNLIVSFLDNTCEEWEWEWDDFTSIKCKDPELEAIRQECVAVAVDCPATDQSTYCNEKGIEILRAIANKLKNNST